MTTEARPWQPSIEGLSLTDLSGRPGKASDVATAARATVAALDAQGLLRDQHALNAQLVLALADAVGNGLSFGGKVSVATAQLTKQLLDAMDKLPQAADTSNPLGDAFEKFAQLILNGRTE